MAKEDRNVEIVDMKKPETFEFPCPFFKLPSGVYLDDAGHLVFWDHSQEATYHLWPDGNVCWGYPEERAAVRRITKIHFE